MNFTRLLQELESRRRPPSHLRKSTRSPAAPADLPTPPAPSQWSKHAACRCLTSIPQRSTGRLTWATNPIRPCSTGAEVPDAPRRATVRASRADVRGKIALLQTAVLDLCLHQDRSVGVSVLPQGEKTAVRNFRVDLLSAARERPT